MPKKSSNLQNLIILYFFIFFFDLKSIELTLCNGYEINYESIDQNFQKPFVLRDLKFTSDIFFSKNEFLYLTDLKVGNLITVKDIKNACFYLKQKNKFDVIKLLVEETANGKNLHFILNAFFTLSQLKIKGMWFGKNQFKVFYLLEPGEQFDILKHEKSINQIKSKLKKDGYFNAQVESFIQYNKNEKLVNVKILINKGKAFPINTIDFEFKKNNLNMTEFEQVNQNIKRLFFKKFVKIKYSWKLLKRKKRELENFLKKINFPFHNVSIAKKVNLKSNNLDIKIIIDLNQKKSWKFIGNKNLSCSQLLEFISRKEEYLLNLPAEILANEILNLYKNKGYLNAKIDCTTKDECSYFNINEGKCALINKINVIGVKAFDKKTLVNKFFKLLINSKFIDLEHLEKIIEKLCLFYIQHGYLNVKIEKQIKPVKDNKYDIELNLTEGEKKYFKRVIIENFNNIESAIFSSFENLKKPMPFNAKIISDQHKLLYDYLCNLGHQNINLIHELKEEKNQISIIWKIKFNENVIRFGKVIIHSNDKKISFDRVMREVKFSENEVLNKDKIEQTYFNLNELKIFESLQVYPASFNDLNGNKPTVVKLFSDDPFELRLRLGLQQVNYNFTTFKGIGTYRVGGSFLYKNPFGIFDHFKIDTDFSSVQKNLVTEYKLPWIFGIPVKTLIKFYWNKFYQPLFIGSGINIYQCSNVGYLASLIKTVEKINFGFNFGIETLKIYGLSDQLAKAIDFSTNLIDKRVPYFFIEPNLIIDYLDDKFTPKKGFLSVASFKGMFSFEDSRDYFLRFLVELSFFNNFLNQTIFAFKVRFGHIFAKPFNRLMPPVRFYLGGPNSVRSYQPDFAPPLGFYLDDDNNKQFVPQGGRTMFNANIEVRIPFKNFDFVIFQDLGLLTHFNFDNLLTATGFGVRYNTPVGPLRFDIGWRTKKHHNDSCFAWFLTFGQAF